LNMCSKCGAVFAESDDPPGRFVVRDSETPCWAAVGLYSIKICWTIGPCREVALRSVGEHRDNYPARETGNLGKAPQ
jgi:hypothetical protein